MTRSFPLAAALLLTSQAIAGGSPENVLIIANPASAESMYLANAYRAARNIPETNILHIAPGAANYQAFAGPGGNLAALFGHLANGRLDDHIDYIVIADPASFYIDAQGLVTDGCWPVARFSLTGAYTLAFMRDQILAGNIPSTTINQYYSTNTSLPLGFDSEVTWVGGNSGSGASSRRYFIGAQLGYTGPLGTTPEDILQMISRSVSADATRPAGTFYYMDNRADPIRNIRACGSLQGCNGQFQLFTSAVNALSALGGAGQIVLDVLPTGRSDCLGILTGASHPTIDTESMTILPGAFCDHLTSWAATFDNPDQTKMSAWIRRGASGTAGTVEEPCAYPGKFPHSTMHVNYYQGLSLGEAYLRSLGYAPFQQMLMGDPVTRPFATPPTIQANFPAGALSGQVSFTPAASTSLPNAAIFRIELYIDGTFRGWGQPGSPFSFPTTGMADGHHEYRVLAYDNTPVRNVGRAIGSFTVNNRGRSASLVIGPPSGTLSTPFNASLTLQGGGTPTQVRLLDNGRIIASLPTNPQFIPFYGRNIGAGTSRVQAEIIYSDGSIVRSAPVPVTVDFSAPAFSPVAPIAYSYTKKVPRGHSVAVELPGAFPDGSGATWNILSGPSIGTLSGSSSQPYRILTAPASACGTDQFTFNIQTPGGSSGAATVTIQYGVGQGTCIADIDADGRLTILDFTGMLNAFASGSLRADINGDCALNILDFTGFLNAYGAGCP